MSDLASDDQIAHQISENSDQQQPQQRSASHDGGCVAGAHTREIWSRLPLEIAVAIEDRCRGWGPLLSIDCCAYAIYIQHLRVHPDVDIW